MPTNERIKDKTCLGRRNREECTGISKEFVGGTLQCVNTCIICAERA
jgi:hypothetical protein